MYAIIRSGGKQYKVQPGDVIRVEKLEAELGSEVDLTEVLMVGGDAAAVGEPLVKGAKVTVVITKQTRDRKVIIFKKKRRQGYRRFATHRQHFTEFFVKSISAGGKTAKAETEANVIDVDKVRLERIEARSEDKKAAKSSESGEKVSKAAKKTVKKAAAKAKKAPAKKAAPKKAKTAKSKTAKKTTKKA